KNTSPAAGVSPSALGQIEKLTGRGKLQLATHLYMLISQDLPKPHEVFVGRWREDMIQGEQTIRVERSMVLGTVAELKTKRIAQRLLDPILARINSFNYRPSKFITLGKFADTWES